MAQITKIIADFQTRLTGKISVGGTSGELQSNLDEDGEALPNGYYFFTIDGDNALKEYIFCQLTGSALSGIYSVSCQGVKTEGVIREHRFGSLIEITNFGQIKLLNDLFGGTDGLDADTPLKYDDTVTISDDKEIATKQYADDAEIQAPPAASESVIGGSKASATPADANNPIFLGDNDPLVPTADEADAMEGSYGTPGSSNKFVTEDNTALDDNVALTGNQTVNGVKTLTSIPVMPGNPTTDNQMANKAYVDSLLA